MRGLYVITPAHETDPKQLENAVRAAIAGGAAWVQFRHKGADTDLALELGQATLAACEATQTPLLVNDHIALALQLNCQGVHLGQNDGAIEDARLRLGPKAIIGRTCHDSAAFMQDAVKAGASYCAFGRLFSSSTKPDAPGLSLARLAQLVTSCPLPVVAIGGINANNAESVLATGTAALAVSGAVFDAPDIAEAAYRLAKYFKETP